MSNDLTQKLNGSLEDKVDRLITVVQSMDSRLGSIETKVDQRLRETQPIWEAMQAQLAEVRDSQQSLREDMQSLREDMQSLREDMQRDVHSLREETQRDVQSLREEISGLRADIASLRAETEKGFRIIDRRMERQIGEFEKLHAYQRDLEDRVDKLEKLSSP